MASDILVAVILYLAVVSKSRMMVIPEFHQGLRSHFQKK